MGKGHLEFSLHRGQLGRPNEQSFVLCVECSHTWAPTWGFYAHLRLHSVRPREPLLYSSMPARSILNAAFLFLGCVLPTLGVALRCLWSIRSVVNSTTTTTTTMTILIILLLLLLLQNTATMRCNTFKHSNITKRGTYARSLREDILHKSLRRPMPPGEFACTNKPQVNLFLIKRKSFPNKTKLLNVQTWLCCILPTRGWNAFPGPAHVQATGVRPKEVSSSTSTL